MSNNQHVVLIAGLLRTRVPASLLNHRALWAGVLCDDSALVASCGGHAPEILTFEVLDVPAQFSAAGTPLCPGRPVFQIHDGITPDDYTYACDVHLGAMLSVARASRVSPASEGARCCFIR